MPKAHCVRWFFVAAAAALVCHRRYGEYTDWCSTFRCMCVWTLPRGPQKLNVIKYQYNLTALETSKWHVIEISVRVVVNTIIISNWKMKSEQTNFCEPTAHIIRKLSCTHTFEMWIEYRQTSGNGGKTCVQIQEEIIRQTTIRKIDVIVYARFGHFTLSLPLSLNGILTWKLCTAIHSNESIRKEEKKILIRKVIKSHRNQRHNWMSFKSAQIFKSMAVQSHRWFCTLSKSFAEFVPFLRTMNWS